MLKIIATIVVVLFPSHQCLIVKLMDVTKTFGIDIKHLTLDRLDEYTMSHDGA